MLWTLCACSVVLLSPFIRGHNTLYEGYTLPPSGYHVCPGIETVPMTTVISYKSAYTQMVPCGGWLPWKMCNVTRYSTVYQTQVIYSEKPVAKCCEGYEQVGSYCALALNRSSEFTAKPGVCPMHPVSGSGSGSGCHWDTDCPGYQKCCSTENRTLCVEPQTHVNTGSWLNMTITVKAEYSLVTTSRGIFNHTRLLHSVVTGALSYPQVSVYHTHSWSSGRFSTSSCLLLGSSQLLSLTNISDTLLLLLENIEEVTAVDVSDVDECATPVLRECSPLASCSNTLGSYSCACAAGSADLQPSRPGTQCTTPSSSSSSSSSWNVISFGPLRKLPRQIISTTLSTSTSSTPPTTSSTAVFNTSFTFPHPVTPCSANSSLVLSIPKISNLSAKNVTSSSFKLSWDVPPQINITSSLVLFHGTHRVGTWVTAHFDWTWTDLQPGVLYTAHVALCMCGNCGNATELKVKTDAQTLQAVARITNINFTEALLDPNSDEYKMLSEKVRNETLRSLDSWILDLILSGKVIVLITGLSPGSVVVTFSLVFVPDSTQNISSIAYKLMESLKSSTQFTVDPNSIKITDVNECALGQDDCSPWADCVDTFGSYTCVCHHGYTDVNPERPGHTCQANSVSASTSSPNTTSPSTVVISTKFSTSSHDLNTTTIVTTSHPNTTETTTSSTSTNSTPVTQGTNGTLTSSTAAPAVPKPNELTAITSITPSSTPPSTTSSTQTPKTTALTSTISTSTSMSQSSASFISHTESITVECAPGYMIISVLRNFLELKHMSESSLYLGVPSCNRTKGNATHVQLFVAWGTCETLMRNNSQNSTVQVTLYNTDARLQVPVICTYINSFIISAGYSSSGYDMINNVVEGSGMFQVMVRLLNGTNPLPQNYTLSPEDEVIIEVVLNSNMSQIKVVINKCWANPSNDPAELPSNVFLENSCPILNEYTRVLQNGESTRSLLAVNLFHLVEFDVIYLHCQIQICIETSTATCRPNCISISRTARTSRGANVVGMAKASCGPLLRSRSEVTLQDAVWNLRTIGFILLALGVCVLALGAVAVAMFCRRRMGNYNFRFKAREENFTYHVFNT